MISCSPFMGIRRSPHPGPALHESLSGPNRFSRAHCLQLSMQAISLAKDMNGHEQGVAYQKRAHPTRRTGGSNSIHSHPFEAGAIHVLTGSRS